MGAAGPSVPVLRDRRDRGPAIRGARRVGVVPAGAERRRGRADLLRERAARTRRARRGHAPWCSGVSRVGRKAGARLSRQPEQAGFDAAMCVALAAEPVLAADETRLNQNVLTSS